MPPAISGGFAFFRYVLLCIYMMRLLISLILTAIAVWLVPSAFAADTAPPDPIEDLRIATSTDSTLTIEWTAPGDDGMSGTVSSYDLRVSMSEILAGEEVVAPIIGGEPDPLPGGETQDMTLKGLKPATKYFLVMKTQDRVGNLSKWSNIVVGETKLDTSGPVMSGMKAIDLTQNSGRIIWTTDEPATSTLYYGETPAYGQVASATSLVKEHSLPVSGLTPDFLYHYQLKSVDLYGNTAETVNMTFQTLSTSTASAVSSVSSGNSSTQNKESVGAPAASVAFSPASINLKSRTTWMTAVLKLPKGAREGMKFGTLRVAGGVKPSQVFIAASQTVLTRYGTLWLRFRRSEIAALVPYEVGEFTLTLTGETKAGQFSAAQTLKVVNNISKAEWERQQAAKKDAFDKDKTRKMGALQKQIDALRKSLQALEEKLRALTAEEFKG